MPNAKRRPDDLAAAGRNPSRPGANLPRPDTKHWLPRHKAEIVAAVSAGVLDLQDACRRYALTPEEFASWEEALDRGGREALNARHMQERRKAERRTLQEPAVALLSAEVGIRCLIIDISPRGARLKLTSVTALPQIFELQCTKSGRSLRVYVVWQRDLMVGVSFETAASWAIEAGLDTWLLGERS